MILYRYFKAISNLSYTLSKKKGQRSMYMYLSFEKTGKHCLMKTKYYSKEENITLIFHFLVSIYGYICNTSYNT